MGWSTLHSPFNKMSLIIPEFGGKNSILNINFMNGHFPILLLRNFYLIPHFLNLEKIYIFYFSIVYSSSSVASLAASSSPQVCWQYPYFLLRHQYPSSYASFQTYASPPSPVQMRALQVAHRNIFYGFLTRHPINEIYGRTQNNLNRKELDDYIFLF